MRPDFGPNIRTQRLSALAIAVAIGYALLLFRSFEIQVVLADDLQRMQTRQSAHQEELPALRGDLIDRNGALLATSVRRYEVWVEAPNQLTEPDRRRIVDAVHAVTHERRDRLRHRLRAATPLVRVAYRLEDEQIEPLRELPRLRFTARHQRSYPSGGASPTTPAGAFIGFLGVDMTPLEGLELAFDEFLAGNTIRRHVQRDGRRRRGIDSFSPAAERRGQTIRLALDSRLQVEAEAALERALERTGARTASLIALDPRTGDVLAIAEAPGFDQNQFWQEPRERFRARSIQDSFEPGSTLKPFVVATALELGVVQPSDPIDCGNGMLRVADRVIRDIEPHGILSVRDALRVSSNICLARIGERVGARSLVEGLRRFGFGTKPSSGFPGETDGVLRDLGDDRPVDRANLAFGQGMRTSALQLALAAATLANEGRRVQPRIALEIGEYQVPSGATDERVVSAETARSVLDMMTDVVSDGTGRAAALDHYTVAGKTGTSQKFIDGTYSHDHFVTSFMGIVPARDPRLVVVVVIDDPVRDRTGGASAAPVFREFTEAALGKLEIVAGVGP